MKIAIVGTGISGLAVAHGLRERHDLTLFEAADYVGGHTHTVDVPSRGETVAIDTGFIVFNDRTYPRFCSLLNVLGVGSQSTEMSFSVHCDRTGVEYNGRNLNTLFAQRRNLLNPRFLGMVRDILRFNREAPLVLSEASAPETLGEYITARSYGEAFTSQYLLPMAAAIWSWPVSQVTAFPLRNFVSFFLHHGLLSVNDRPQWRVVQGASRAYVQALIPPIQDRIRLRTPVQRVRRMGGGVEVLSQGQGAERFDRVILATHSDQALRILADATPLEQSLIGVIRYHLNVVTLHTDVTLLPWLKRAWAAWNYRIPHEGEAESSVTYNMNILQGLRTPETFCVTLGEANIDPAHVIQRFTYHHPIFTPQAAAAQLRVGEISGVGGVHFCGAYWGNGFHEDGMASAERVVAEVQAAEQSQGGERRRTA